MIIGYVLAKWYLKGSMFLALGGVIENITQAGVGYMLAIVPLPIVQKQINRIR